MSNEHAAGELTAVLLDIYKERLAEMKADGSVNVSLLKEVREFLKQHDIELDANAAPMQDLTHDVNEIAAWKAKRSQSGNS